MSKNKENNGTEEIGLVTHILVTIQIYSSGMIKTISSANGPLEFEIWPTCQNTRNHTRLGLKNKLRYAIQNGLQNLYGNITH